MRKRIILSIAGAGALLLSAACTTATETPTSSVPIPTATTRVAATSTVGTVSATPTVPALGTATTGAVQTPIAATPTRTAAGTATVGGVTGTVTPGASTARLSIMPWAVGQQAKYEGASSQGTATYTYSLVDREGADWWYELKIEATGQPTTIVKMLVSDFSQGGPMSVKRMIMQQQGQPAYEMPASMMAQMQRQVVSSDTSRVNNSIVGTETKIVKAGTFTNAVHARYVDSSTNTTTDGYFHATVPITGMVHVVSTTQGQPPVTMELLSTRTSGATTEITGPVQRFPGA